MTNQKNRGKRQQALLTCFPRIFRGSCPGLEYASGWDEVVHRLCERIDALLSDTQAEHFEIVQIKEKYGTLRCYYSVAESSKLHLDLIVPDRSVQYLVFKPTQDKAFPTKEVDALIESAEEETSRTCEICGRAGRLHDELSWWRVLCPTCLDAKLRTQWSE